MPVSIQDYVASFHVTMDLVTLVQIGETKEGVVANSLDLRLIEHTLANCENVCNRTSATILHHNLEEKKERGGFTSKASAEREKMFTQRVSPFR